jgi:hypothetical protein
MYASATLEARWLSMRPHVTAKRSLFMFAVLNTACLLASADELLIAGRVASVLLVARGAPGCIDPADLPPEQKDGVSKVMVSNSCGCQESTIVVDKTYLGQSPGASLVLKAPLGEWCRPALTVSMRPALIQVKDGSVRSAPLDGDDRFSVKPFASIAGVQASALPVDGDGKTSLKALLARANAVH